MDVPRAAVGLWIYSSPLLSLDNKAGRPGAQALALMKALAEDHRPQHHRCYYAPESNQ